MNERKMSQIATDWLDHAKINPEEFKDLEDMTHVMDRDGVSAVERRHIFKVLALMDRGE